MKRIFILFVLVLFAGSAMAQSAKFTAVYKDTIDGEFVRSEACADVNLTFCDDLGIEGIEDDNEVVAKIATIKVPQAKELLVGLSAQVALFTETLVKGKRGSYSKAVAMAEGAVTLFACNLGSETCYMGAPGYVVLNHREQTLEAVLAGVIESCDVEVVVDETANSGYSGSFDLSDCTVLDEMIGLGIDTLSAHHFNFLFPNLPQGDYEVYAKFATAAAASAETYCYYESEALGCVDETSGSAAGHAYAYIGKYMMTVQTVRAVKDENGDPEVVAD